MPNRVIAIIALGLLILCCVSPQGSLAPPPLVGGAPGPDYDGDGTPDSWLIRSEKDNKCVSGTGWRNDLVVSRGGTQGQEVLEHWSWCGRPIKSFGRYNSPCLMVVVDNQKREFPCSR